MARPSHWAPSRMREKSREVRSLAVAEPAEGGTVLGRRDRDLADLRSTRGVVFVEYVALLLLVTITGAAAVLALGVPLINLFRFQQIILSLPIP